MIEPLYGLDVWSFIYLIFVAYAIGFIIVDSIYTKTIREKFLYKFPVINKLVRCYFCVSFWFSLLFQIYNGYSITDSIFNSLAVASAVFILHILVEAVIKTARLEL